VYFSTRSRHWPTAHLPDELEPGRTLGSLAGTANVRTVEFFDRESGGKGTVVSVGAHRLADGEVASYSSGGPSRHSEAEDWVDRPRRFSAAQTSVEAMARDRPDVTAPGDIGEAQRGLRGIGMRSGEVARISGTSAAAPVVARTIANMRHALRWLSTGNAGSDGHLEAQLKADLGLGRSVTNPSDASRPTNTPTKDDTFRRGLWRVW
jgi:hypothetical protein